ncbi:D-2-hydroxyacid dehydrogenase [Ruania halotolerans]|uniref:D-2-hydroxyacid dehydrogenase n=1 Tax=Ruania halotolerans TaxID=2897773 RepID=UPI001E48525C|nr:D-2-hydroxyacid dehydrogenase [Ruania halotolerans]UFU07516.1 D-2-hydroxyacid dehydrogenase [Ruania halotolerans]
MPDPTDVLVLHEGAPPASPALEELAARVPLRFTDEAHLAEELPGAEVLYLHHFLSRALPRAWPAADALRWVHVAAAGVDPVLFDDLVSSEVAVTNSRGVFDDAIAEYVLGQIIAEAKDFRSCWADQDRRTWRHRESARVAGSTALVVGTGAIGRAIARLLRAVGMQVSGAGRRVITDDPDFGTVTDDLNGALGHADWVVAVAPLTPTTRGMFDAAAFGAMRSDARLINVGRGELVRTEDLVHALTRGDIAGAVLDVTDPEPLPAEHPLWTMAGVTVTAHQSGDVQGWREELDRLFAENLTRWRDGRDLHNVVDTQLGYVPTSRSQR